MDLTAPSLFGNIYMGIIYLYCCIGVNTPIFTKNCSSLCKVYLFILGVG